MCRYQITGKATIATPARAANGGPTHEEPSDSEKSVSMAHKTRFLIDSTPLTPLQAIRSRGTRRGFLPASAEENQRVSAVSSPTRHNRVTEPGLMRLPI